jgi:transposase
VSEAIIIGLDIAKHVFHAHGADERGRATFSKRIGRGTLLDFFVAQPSCTVGAGGMFLMRRRTARKCSGVVSGLNAFY